MKKKMRAFACAAAATLAIVPFLSGCTANNEADNGQGEVQENITEQQQGATGEGVVEDVMYGAVMAVNGNEVTVVLGELDHPSDGEEQTFTAGEDEIVFDKTVVGVTDESGASVDPEQLGTDDVIVMRGDGAGADFKPYVVEIVDLPYEAGEQAN